VLLDISGPIGPATTLYLERGMAHAAEVSADALILQIDTPGGLVTSLRDINRLILASPIPVIAYVAPGGARAASAGAYIVYASHLAAMAPGTNIGAATPVQMGGAPGRNPQSPEPEPEETADSPAKGKTPASAEESKAVNDAVAYIRSLAEIHGRNADWAESAVREAASLPAREALEQHVIELIANDRNELLAQADGRSVNLLGKPATLSTQDMTVVPFEPDWRIRLLSVLTNPNLAYILLLLGIYGIIFELMSPGAIFPGATGAIALVTALLALNMLPISFAGIALLLLGLGLMVAEAFVASFGMLGIAGLVSFVVGSIFLFDGTIPGFTLSPLVIGLATLVTLALLALMLTSAVRAHRRQAASGDEAFIGSFGTVVRWTRDAGLVQVNGETWQARSNQALSPGATVRIVQRDGLVVTVAPQAAPEVSAPHR